MNSSEPSSALFSEKDGDRGSFTSGFKLYKNGKLTRPSTANQAVITRPHVHLAIICSDSSIDVVSLARLLHYQLANALEADEALGRTHRFASSTIDKAEMERTKQYLAELSHANAVKGGAPIREDLKDEKVAEEEGGSKGKRKSAGGSVRRGGGSGKKQGEEELVTVTPEHMKEIEEERHQLMEAYLQPFEFSAFHTNSLASFDSTTRILFLYELLHQDELLQLLSDDSKRDIDFSEYFWKTIELLVSPEDGNEITLVWPVHDIRLLHCLKAAPSPASGKPEVNGKGPKIHTRMIIYANDAQFLDPTASAPAAGDKRSSRFSSSKKGSTGKKNSQSNEGSRGASRSSRSSKSSAKATPTDAIVPNFLDADIDTDRVLYECQTFGEFIEKHTHLQKQVADTKKLVEATKPPGSDCEPNWYVMLQREEIPESRATAVATPTESLPSPFEAQINKQRTVPVSSSYMINPSATLPRTGTINSAFIPSMSAGDSLPFAKETGGASWDGTGVSSSVVLLNGRSNGLISSLENVPEPVWTILRANQILSSASDKVEDDWISTCRRKIAPELYNLASIVSIFSHWQSSKTCTALPPQLQKEFRRRLLANYKGNPRDRITPHSLSAEELEALATGISPEELQAKLGPIVDGSFRVYQKEKLIGGQYVPCTALMGLISQATANLIEAQPMHLIQLEEDYKLPPVLSSICEAQSALSHRSIFRKDTSEERGEVGDNHGPASVLPPEVSKIDPIVCVRPSSSGLTPVPPAAGSKPMKDAKKAVNSKRVVVEVKEEVPNAPPPPKRVPSEWVFPLDHCHFSTEPSPSRNEVEWLVKHYVQKGLGKLSEPVEGALQAVQADKGRKWDDPAQAVHLMKQLHGGRVGARLLPFAEEAHQNIFLLRGCYDLMEHLNLFSYKAFMKEAPVPSLMVPQLHDKVSADSNGLLWHKRPEDLMAYLMKSSVIQDESLKHSVARNLTAREREHIIQQSIAVELGRCTGLLSNGASSGTVALTIEEVLSLPTALNRLSTIPSRFGLYIASIFSFAAEEQSRTAAEMRVQQEMFSAMHSTKAENIYPPRRGVQFWVAGIRIPPYRRKNLIWVYPVSGCLTVEQFTAWKRWESITDKEKEVTQSHGTGPVTFAPSIEMNETEGAGGTDTLSKTNRSEGNRGSKAHDQLDESIIRKLLAKVLAYKSFLLESKEACSRTTGLNPGNKDTVTEADLAQGTSAADDDARVLGQPQDGEGSFRFGKDLFLAPEGHQIFYPFCDAVVEVLTTQTSRQCRYLASSEVTATLHYNIPPPLTPEQGGDWLYELSLKSAPPAETAYLSVRFDDGLTLTVANRFKPPPPRPPPQLVNANRMAERDTAGAHPHESVQSLGSMNSTSSKKSKTDKKKRRDKRSSSKRRTSGANTDEAEKPGDNIAQDTLILRKQAPLCPPLAANGDVRLWTARGELPSEHSGREGLTKEGGSRARPSVNSVSMGNEKNTSLSERTFGEIKGTKNARNVEPLDITIASNNFTFFNQEQDGMLWFSYCLGDGENQGENLSLSETLWCVHRNCGADSELEPSMEREIRRAVVESTGMVIRYFESGVIQTLLPNGTVVSRYKELWSEKMPRRRGPDGMGASSLSERFCETLTMPNGSIYVRSTWSFSPRDAFSEMMPADPSLCFVRLSKARHLHVFYDPLLHCHTISREDGVIVAYYYRKDVSSPVVQSSSYGDYAAHMNPHQINAGTPADFDAWDVTPGLDGKINAFTGTLNSQLRGNEGYEDTLHRIDSSSMDENIVSALDVYARVTLHADGTTITTVGVNMDGVLNTVSSDGSSNSDAAPSIASLLSDVLAVESACQSSVTWCIESPRTPRIFLLSVIPRLEILLEVQQQYHEAMGKPPVDPQAALQAVKDKRYDSFYLVFGDGSVLKRHIISRPTRGTVVTFQETVFTRPTDSAVRINHDNGLAVVERTADIKRNLHNAAASAIGEGFAVFDLALGGFRLVDYLSHVTSVSDVYSPFGVSASLTYQSWNELLSELVHSTFSAHRLPKLQMEKRKAAEEAEQAAERNERAKGRCPSLLHRMREMAEEFVISNGLLQPDVLHTLEKEGQNAKGIKRENIQEAQAETQQGEVGQLWSVVGQLAPVFFCQRANGEVVQFWNEAGMKHEVDQEGGSEAFKDPIYMLNSVASGEPGVQQLSLFRVKNEMGTKYTSSLPKQYTATASLLSEHETFHCRSTGAPHKGSLRDLMERQQKLSSFYNGMSFAAHYYHAENPVFDSTIRDPSRYCGSFTRWLPRECQPPRSFLQPAAPRERVKGGVIELKEGESSILNNGCHEAVRTFLQFQETPLSVINMIFDAELQQRRQPLNLSEYHQVMSGSFPAMSQKALDEQARLQELYYKMKAKTET